MSSTGCLVCSFFLGRRSPLAVFPRLGLLGVGAAGVGDKVS